MSYKNIEDKLKYNQKYYQTVTREKKLSATQKAQRPTQFAINYPDWRNGFFVLNETEKTILVNFFGLLENKPKSLRDIAEGLGRSHEYVRKIKDAALEKLEKTSVTPQTEVELSSPKCSYQANHSV